MKIYYKVNKLEPKTGFVGKNTIFLPTCHSTNDICAKLISENDIIDGTIVYTDFQTAGRGQRGKSWESAQGLNIMASLVLKSNFILVKNQFNLNIVFSLALNDVFKNILGDNFTIKWPNDLFFNELKLGGILIENTIQGQFLKYSIIGFGININQIEFENSRSTSLKNILKKPIEREKILEKILEKTEEYLLKLNAETAAIFKKQFEKNLLGYNTFRFFEINNVKRKGKITGITDFGQLIVDFEHRTDIFSNQEIKFLFD